MSVLAAAGVATQLLNALREAFFMFWETLWALVLGFTLSGVVQSFVSTSSMQRRLGTHRMSAVLRASGYGMASSSCSYAASAMSKSLFAKGADFATAMIFMIASTNLVVELGLVLLVLMGWQFMAAEFVGGPVMIAIVALLGGVVFSLPLVERARTRLSALSTAAHNHGSGDSNSPASWRSKVRSRESWSDAANYAVADVTMLRRELIFGYLVAGALAALVPAGAWHGLFFHGHGWLTVLENALVGPLIAVLSWVCSVGNVPLAAALWSGGISFGGVVSFIFADLITMPLILIYRKFYGTALTVRVVGLFYVAMVSAGLVTQGVFTSLDAVPSHRVLSVANAHFSWDYTSYLNIVFIGVAAGVWWLARRRRSLNENSTYAIDPVCAMQVRRSDAPATATYDSVTYYFCADRCRERFEAKPERFIGEHAVSESMDEGPVAVLLGRKPGVTTTAIDPICQMTVDPETAAAKRERDGRTHWFCSVGCAEQFDSESPK